MNNALKHIRHIVYKLKREQGVTIILVNTTYSAQNLETGVITKSNQNITIKRAVMLPYMQVKQVFASGAPFDFGGIINTSTRFVIIDKIDLPADFEITTAMHIIYDSRQYEIEQVQRTVEGYGWLLRVRDIQNTRT